MSISAEDRRLIRDADRAQIESLLVSNGYQVYDHESTEDLRECLLNDVEAGIIDAAELDLPTDRLPDPRDR